MCTMTPSSNGFPVALSQSKPAKQPEDADQAIVYTPYGRGLVIRSRKSDDIKEVQLLEWEGFSKPSREPFMMYTAVDYPSVIPHVGDDVVCQYGRGRVVKITRVTDANQELTPKYSIALSSWRLNGRSTATCHVTSPPPRVVRKHTLSEMDAHEKVALAKSKKMKATDYFSKKKDYKLALTTYASAVDAVRNVQHDHTSTNEVRADLVVVMVTCSNNAATCCIKMEKWDEASKYAKNALILLDALYGKRGKKIHSSLNKEGSIDAKLFGEWRVKSYLVVARSSIEKGEVSVAMGVLKIARGVAMGYIEEINAKQQTCSKEEKASLKSLTTQVKEIRRLLVECSDKKKATKKMEKKRAKAMFGGDKGTAQPSEANTKKDGEQQHKKKTQEEKANVTIPTKTPVGKSGAGSVTIPTKAPVDESGDSVVSDQENEIPSRRKSLLNTRKGDSRPTLRKSVSFSQRPPQVKEFDSSAEDTEDDPWYAEHKEAMIMLAVAGFSAFALIAMRKSFK